jgi:5-methylcytosine-specific restriction endonuclease McrA
MRELLDKKIGKQNGRCGICGEKFEDYTEIVPDHKDPRGMGGARRNDDPDNIQAAHSRCNLLKGSKRL